jgi:hypothetical protein
VGCSGSEPQPAKRDTQATFAVSATPSTRTSTLERGRVVAVHRRRAERLIRIETASGSITTTPEHPFALAHGSWQPAAKLKGGDRIFSASAGEPALVSSVRAMESGATSVYNLTVEGSHTYFVGAESLLVHNTCRPKRKAAGASGDAAQRAKKAREWAEDERVPQPTGPRGPDVLKEHESKLAQELAARRKRNATSAEITEILGEMAATEYMKKHYPGFRLMSGYGKGTGVDQVWSARVNGKTVYIIVEAKGRGAALGVGTQHGDQMSTTWALDAARKVKPPWLAESITGAIRGDTGSEVYGIVLEDIDGTGRMASPKIYNPQNGGASTTLDKYGKDTLLNQDGLFVYHRPPP